MKITIYELLGLIKDGKAPKKIKVDSYILDLIENETNWKLAYIDGYNDYLFTDYLLRLDDEVEIIEEEKEDNFSGIRYFANGNCYMSIASEPPKIQDITIEKEIEKLNKKHFHKRQRQLANKINELIDEVNKLKRSEK